MSPSASNNLYRPSESYYSNSLSYDATAALSRVTSVVGEKSGSGRRSFCCQGKPADDSKSSSSYCTTSKSRSQMRSHVSVRPSHGIVTNERGQQSSKSQANGPATDDVYMYTYESRTASPSHESRHTEDIIAEGGTIVPDIRREPKRNLTFAKRKLFFDASASHTVHQDGTIFADKPQYSVSYKNYPNIAFDVVDPTNDKEFYNERRQPGFFTNHRSTPHRRQKDKR